MMSKKIKVLLAPSDPYGVGHYRSIWPGLALDKYYNEDFEVEINEHVNTSDINYLKKFDIIHFHRQLGSFEETHRVIPILRASGVICVLDIDDYWEPSTTHPLYSMVKEQKLDEKILSVFPLADYITTTTEIFARHLREHNKNVFVMPNSLDMDKPMWSSDVMENPTEKCRIAWIGGSSHMSDLKLLEPSITRLYNNKELEDKFQFVLCGFDTRGKISEQMPDGSIRQRTMRPEETVWLKFEDIFTNKSCEKNKEPEYFQWLSKLKKEEYPGQYEKNYVRRWTLPLTQYGYHYNYCDVCLAPLVETDVHRSQKGQITTRPHLFNEVKSELKIIEAGMKKKVLIAQDFGIYKELLEHGKTALLVSDNKDGWYKAMRDVVNSKDLREELTNNLHEFVKDKYDIKTVTNTRADFYKSLILERDKKQIVEVQATLG